LAGTPVFGLAGLGIPDALDAGVAAPGGAQALGGTALAGTGLADRAARPGLALAAPWAQAAGDSQDPSPTGTFAVTLFSNFRIAPGHWSLLQGLGGQGSGD